MKLPPKYWAPDPTPAQIENGKLRGYDPYDLVGNITFIDLARDHVFAAAGTVHDEQTLRGVEKREQRLAYDNIFADNCLVLAAALPSSEERVFYEMETWVFHRIISLITLNGNYPQENRNSRETEIQGWKNQIFAQHYINQVARAMGLQIPCPVPVMPVWSD